jgi:predicted dinucleotide-binding enzyme
MREGRQVNVGIIGSGKIGRAVATRLIDGDHHVWLSNSRGPESLAELEQELGQAASAATVEDAIREGDVVIVATPLAAVAGLPADALSGKIVVDANNYYPQRDGHIAELDDGLGSSEWLAAHLPGARVVKAFNTMWSENILHKAVPHGAEERVAMPVASDDEAAKATVSALVDDMGFDPVDGGTLRDGRRQQPGTPVYNVLLDADGVRDALDQVPEA